MPMNPTNPPGQRDAPFRSDDDASGGSGGSSGGADPDKMLKIENMLLEEFNYASTTAYQAMEDRARMFNMYLLVVGILGSAFGAVYPLGGGARNFVQPVAAVVLFAAGMAGVAFFVLLIRLRQAFRDSLITMNMVKEFYIEEFGGEKGNFARAFHWRLDGIPKGERLGSATYVVCHMVAFVGALCFGGSVFMADELLIADFPGVRIGAFGSWQSPLFAVAAFLLAMIIMAAYYRKSLSLKKEKKQILDAEKAVGEK